MPSMTYSHNTPLRAYIKSAIENRSDNFKYWLKQIVEAIIATGTLIDPSVSMKNSPIRSLASLDKLEICRLWINGLKMLHEQEERLGVYAGAYPIKKLLDEVG
jgi:hypothetical protein